MTNPSDYVSVDQYEYVTESFEAREAADYVFRSTGTEVTFYHRYDDAWMVLDKNGNQMGRDWWDLDSAVESLLIDVEEV